MVRGFHALSKLTIPRYFSYKSKYTQPLTINKYEISPSGFVPEHIIRPPYVGQDPQIHGDILGDPIHIMSADE